TAANVAIIKNPDLAERLAKRTTIGSFIPKNLFTEVATILVQNGLA
ncbi:EscU/YscU/HrcU family type III secretion system export apparatus switch protein, partial [Aliidongia sp.]